MTDIYFNEAGDLEASSSGDLAITDSPWRDIVQQAYICIMTDMGDYVLYPTLGASLSSLYGLPQNSSTGSLGVSLIESALTRESTLSSSSFSVKAVPTGPQTIRFDVSVQAGSLQQIKLAVEQNLGMVQ